VKLILLVGAHANQRALAHRLSAVAPIAAIVCVTPRQATTGEGAVRRALARVRRGLVGLPLRRAWFGMLDHFERAFPHFPVPPSLHVDDVNSEEVAALVDRERPDLVVVSGTNLLKGPLIERIERTGRVMNLHTGISPYIRGGPNCTNWCLSIRRFDLIGNTVMWLDKGIDSGNLIATERTPLDGQESLTQLQIKVMDHAHGLYVRCVEHFVEGRPLPSVPQASLGKGLLFLTRQWTARAIVRAIVNHALHYRRGAARLPADGVILISPDGAANG